jgi:hypothetical protein
MKRFVRFTLLVFTLSLVSSFAETPIPPPTKHRAQNGPHPVICEAIKQLEHTKTTLQKDASPDPEGNRAEAVVLIEEAIEQLNLTLQPDKK